MRFADFNPRESSFFREASDTRAAETILAADRRRCSRADQACRADAAEISSSVRLYPVDAHAVPPILLRLVELLIGPAKQVICAAMGSQTCSAEARRHFDAMFRSDEGLRLQGTTDAFSRGHGAICFRVRQQDHEFLSAPSAAEFA